MENKIKTIINILENKEIKKEIISDYLFELQSNNSITDENDGIWLNDNYSIAAIFENVALTNHYFGKSLNDALVQFENNQNLEKYIEGEYDYALQQIKDNEYFDIIDIDKNINNMFNSLINRFKNIDKNWDFTDAKNKNINHSK